MTSAMPPLSALRAFEAAARHLSFSRAAVELSVTPGALSHQVRGLEDFLGLALFERRPRGIALTEAGRLLYPGLQAGFGLVRDAVAGLRARGEARVLVLATSPGLTAKWLAPRLYRFAEAWPDIDLRISSSPAYADLFAGGIDAALRSAPANAPEEPALVHEKLIEGNLAVVCSPALLARFGGLAAAGDLVRVPLLHDDSLAADAGVPTLADWCGAAGLDLGDLGRGLRFNGADHALAAALEGGGLLLTQTVLARGDLESGRLVQPFATELASGRAYYLVYPKIRAGQPGLPALAAWLRGEAAASPAGLAPAGEGV